MKRFALVLIMLFSLGSLTGFGMCTADLTKNSETEKVFMTDSKSVQVDVIAVEMESKAIKLETVNIDYVEVPIESDSFYTQNIYKNTSAETYVYPLFRTARDGFWCSK